MKIVRVIKCLFFRDIFYEIWGLVKLVRVTISYIIYFIAITS